MNADEGFRSKAEELEELRGRIDQLQERLRSERRREDSLTEELRRLDQRISEAAGALRDAERRAGEVEERVARLRQRYAAERERLAGHRRHLAQQVRAAYSEGREEYLRLLLKQQDPDRLDRMLVYYRYLSRARGERIYRSVDALTELRRLRAELEEELTELARLRERREQKHRALQERRGEREHLLAEIRERLDSGDDRLQRLREDEAELASLVEQLQSALADIPDTLSGERPFEGSKGSLDWPLEGTLAARYGASRSGPVEWSGVLIEAEEGAPVRAVATGRVVFADWLRGLGLLLIIDHGDGYMTLYGHNQSVFKDVGNWVQAGEVIASVGASGGRRGSALYFEVRANGKPVNPLSWLRPAASEG